MTDKQRISLDELITELRSIAKEYKPLHAEHEALAERLAQAQRAFNELLPPHLDEEGGCGGECSHYLDGETFCACREFVPEYAKAKMGEVTP